MNRIKAALLAGAAACIFGAMPYAADAAGTAHVAAPAADDNGLKHDSAVLQNMIDGLNTTLDQQAAPGQNSAALRMRAVGAGSDLRAQALAVAVKADEVARKADAEAKTKTSGGVQSIDGVPSAKNNFKSDYLQWETSTEIYPLKNGAIDLDDPYCLGANNTVYGMSKDFTAGPQPDGTGDKPAPNYLHVKLDEGGLIVKGVDWDNPKSNNALQVKPRLKDTADAATCPTDPTGTPITKGTAITLTTKSDFFVAESDAQAARREGWDYGTLVVPFKFQLSDKSAVVASASLGAYIGYRVPWLRALDLRPVLFAGLSEVPVEQIGTGGKATTETMAGLSYGGGVIGTIKDDFSWGLIFGADHVNSIQQYKYQDKPWVSLVLGLSLSQ